MDSCVGTQVHAGSSGAIGGLTTAELVIVGELVLVGGGVPAEEGNLVSSVGGLCFGDVVGDPVVGDPVVAVAGVLVGEREPQVPQQ